MKIYNKTKTYICSDCKKKSEVVVVLQKETRYYSLNLKTNQWQDFHGDGSVESQKFFCVNCKKNISSVISRVL